MEKIKVALLTLAVVALFLLALGNRYEVSGNGSLVVDGWTGEIVRAYPDRTKTLR